MSADAWQPPTFQEQMEQLKYAAANDLYFEICGESAAAFYQQITEKLSQTADIAAATAHRACHSAEHNAEQGRLHGYCIVCGVPWPCETAEFFLRSRKA
jgi:hypothetical protein